MLGAIAGDVIGSTYEFHPIAKEAHWNDFPLFPPKSRFTDDTVMTLAVAEALQQSGGKAGFSDCLIDAMHRGGDRWPHAGYGGSFRKWLKNKSREPYNSYGNGSAMRVSPVGWAATSLEEAEELARLTAEVTHNHPEGIKGAQAVAGAIFLARNGAGKEEIRYYAAKRHGYNLSRSLAEIRPEYCFDETCQRTVPEAITVFLESENFEDAIRKAVWLRGDADTMGAIVGGIAQAHYGGVPEEIASKTLELLDPELYETWSKTWAWLNPEKKEK